MNCGYNDDADRNKDFERKRIDNRRLLGYLCVISAFLCGLFNFTPASPQRRRGTQRLRREVRLFYGIAGVNPGACSTGDVDEVGKTMFP